MQTGLKMGYAPRAAVHQRCIPCAIFRGGTSKGLLFREEDLPSDPEARDALLLRGMGSPDPQSSQMDGLGGGYSSVSKVAVLSPRHFETSGHHVNYLFGQVSVTESKIDWSGSCGNLVAAVAVWAIEEGLVTAPEEPSQTSVSIWNANHGKVIEAHVPCISCAPLPTGSFRLDGVSHPGSEIQIDFLAPGSGPGGSVLPTGLAQETIELEGGDTVPVTLINAGNPTVIVSAEAIGLDATENMNIHSDVGLMERLETLRCLGAIKMGIGDASDPSSVTFTHPAAPKIAWVGKKEGDNGTESSSPLRELTSPLRELNARIMSMGSLHHAFTGIAAIEPIQ